MGFAHDENLYGYTTKPRWYEKFRAVNSSKAVDVRTIPLNVPFVVLSERVQTLYQKDRGHFMMTGSVFLRNSANTLVAIEAYEWGRGYTMPVYVYNIDGEFGFYPDKLEGLVCMLDNVNPCADFFI